MRRVLAVDFGGTKTALARVDEDGTCHDCRRLPAAHDLEASVHQVVAAIEGVDAVGIVVPGIYTPGTGLAWCPNLWGREEVPLGAALQDRVRVPVAIDSDRAGYVLGESWLGAARGLRDVVFLSISTGIGAGILSGGQLVRGAHGIAGAVGWFALDPAWKEAYGRAGCWESESAGPALARLFGASDAEAVVAAARAGDARALAVVDRAACYCAMGIANMISLLNPEAVVLGGGVVHGAADLMIGRVRAEVPRWAQPVAAARCRIEPSQLGQDAGLLGAARLALSQC